MDNFFSFCSFIHLSGNDNELSEITCAKRALVYLSGALTAYHVPTWSGTDYFTGVGEIDMLSGNKFLLGQVSNTCRHHLEKKLRR